MSEPWEEAGEITDLASYQRKIADRLHEEKERRKHIGEPLAPSMKAEMINGQMVFHPPVMLRHNLVRMNLSHLMFAHARRNKLGTVGEESLLVCCSANAYQPDIVFYDHLQSAELKSDQTRFPAPAMVVEVLSPLTENLTRGVKFRDYAAHGVREYWLVDPTAEFVEQYENVDARFSLLLKAGNGQIKSATLAGFEIPVCAIFDSDENFSTLARLLGK